jgi:hypothetical protein
MLELPSVCRILLPSFRKRGISYRFHFYKKETTMGILSNTVNICHFRVVGEIPTTDIFQWASERLAKNGFRNIDDGADELSTGWVSVDDSRESDFDVPGAFWRDHYLVFSLRRDQRRVPAAVLKAGLREAESRYLAENPGLRRVPKQKREDLREAIRSTLLARTLPVPAVWDAVWDTRTNLMTFTSLTSGIIELFENQFKKSFEGLRLVAIHPFARAGQVIGDDLQPSLQKANQSSSEAAADLVRSNLWLGRDFLLWLLYRTINDTSEYRVNQPGPAVENEQFTAYLNDRLVLMGESENGTQKITVAGPQDRFSEVRMALSNGKQIVEATLHLEKDELLWKLTLKGDLFQFASLKAPSVIIEKDNTVDAASEREAVFFERMCLLENGLQLFDSLYATFLGNRLSEKWLEEERLLAEWQQAE